MHLKEIMSASVWQLKIAICDSFGMSLKQLW